ncbi:MAG: signal peptidase II [Myxococcota bacterium]
MTPKLRFFLTLFVVTLLVDQVTKGLVAWSLPYGDQSEVLRGFFYLTHVRNPGAAFSFLADQPAWFRQPFFIGVTGVAIFIIISFYRRLAPGDRLSAFALGAILGGAVGNLLDRLFRSDQLFHGEVVDFLHFILWGGYAWPDFNFADTFIVCGVALLVLELFATEGESRADPART